MIYSKTCVRQPPSRLTLNSGWCGKNCLSYKGTCHVNLLAKLHDMYLYKTTTFSHQPLRSISKVAVLHRFYCTMIVIWWETNSYKPQGFFFKSHLYIDVFYYMSLFITFVQTSLYQILCVASLDWGVGGGRLHKVLGQIGSKRWFPFPWQQKAPIVR